MNPSENTATPRFAASTNIQNIFFYLTGISALVIYCYTIYQNAYNIPKWDDFPELLHFLDRWLAAKTAADKFHAFISQTNEHILLVNHLLVLTQYYLIGHINFAWLIYIGNVFYIGSALALWQLLASQSNRAFCFAVIMLVGVTFYAYDSTLWAMTAISNQAVIFFSFLAIHAASRQSRNMFVIMLVSTLAVFSQSNGLIILFVLGCYFFSFKKWLELKQWLAFTIVIVGLYAYWFNPASLHDPSQPSTLAILQQLPLQNYLLTAPIFLAYLGGNIFTQATLLSFLAATAIGTVIFVITLAQIKRRAYQDPALLIIGFLLLSIVSIAAYRGLFAGPSVAFVSRYKMYGAYFLVVAVLLSPSVILKLQQSHGWRFGILAISSLYFAWSFPANLPQAKIIDTDLFRSIQYWVVDGDLRRARGFFIRDTDSYLFAALKNKTYDPMVVLPRTSVIENIKQLNTCPAQYSDDADITIDFVISHQNPNAAAIKLNSYFAKETRILITLCSEQQFYQLEIDADKNTQNTTEFFVARNTIAPGSYKVWVEHNNKHYRLKNPFLNKAATR